MNMCIGSLRGDGEVFLYVILYLGHFLWLNELFICSYFNLSPVYCMKKQWSLVQLCYFLCFPTHKQFHRKHIMWLLLDYKPSLKTLNFLQFFSFVVSLVVWLLLDYTFYSVCATKKFKATSTRKNELQIKLISIFRLEVLWCVFVVIVVWLKFKFSFSSLPF